MLMNEEPRPQNVQPNDQQDQSEGKQPFYNAEDQPQSTFSGYDLTERNEQNPEPHVAEQAAPPEASDQVLLEWEAAEYVHHQKGPMWFMGLAGATVVLIAIAFFWTHSWTFIALLVVMAIVTGVYANRQPRTLHYVLTRHALRIDSSEYHYSDFRAFGVLDDGVSLSAVLIPVKRFMPAVTMFFPQEYSEDIVDILGSRLPMEELHLDFIDVLTRKMRF